MLRVIDRMMPKMPAKLVFRPLSPSLTTKVTPESTEYMNDASAVLPLRVDCASSERLRNEQLLRVTTTLCPFLLSDTSDDPSKAHEEDQNIDIQQRLSVKTLVGGLSNALFVISSTSSHRSVLVRIHPTNDRIVDRNAENRILAWLSDCGKAPVFYGRFENGRVEQFYENVSTLSCHEMSLYAKQIAARIADLHGLSVPDNVMAQSSTGLIWSRVEEWFQLAHSLEKTGRVRYNETTPSPIDVKMMHQEWKWLKSQLAKESTLPGVIFARQVVFAHMDAQSLNFLKSSNDFDDLKLIDFEYSGMHPRAADIANTFCEYCDMNNLKGRWEEEYPTEAQQEEFLDAYLARCEVEMDAASRRQFQHEVNKHALVSHLGWATWSVLQHSLSDIDFDYLAYARHRMDGYRYFKKKYWSEEP